MRDESVIVPLEDQLKRMLSPHCRNGICIDAPCRCARSLPDDRDYEAEYNDSVGGD